VRGTKRPAPGSKLPNGISFRNISSAYADQYAASARGCSERKMLLGLPHDNSAILIPACQKPAMAQLELMLTLARTNKQVLGHPAHGVVTTPVDVLVERLRRTPDVMDAFLCRELTKRICNWVVSTCVEVADDVSCSKLREWLVDASYEYGRCCFAIALGYITNEHGKRGMTWDKMFTFVCDDGTEVTLDGTQHCHNMWKAAIAGRTRSKGLDTYSDLYDHAMDRVAESRSRRLHSEAMMAWRKRADDHVEQCCRGRSDLIGAIRVMLLDQLASPSDTKQSSERSTFMLKHCTHEETVISSAKLATHELSDNVSYDGARILMRLHAQCLAIDAFVNSTHCEFEMNLTKLFCEAISGRNRVNAATPRTEQMLWWHTSRTLLGRRGSMRTFIQDMSQYKFDPSWLKITIMDCPKKWWLYIPCPIMYAIIDSSFAYYICCSEKSSANHQEDGMAAIRTATHDDPINQASIWHVPGTQRRVDRHMSLFEAARSHYLLTKEQHNELVKNRGVFLDAYQAWFNGASKGPQVVRWDGSARTIDYKIDIYASQRRNVTSECVSCYVDIPREDFSVYTR